MGNQAGIEKSKGDRIPETDIQQPSTPELAPEIDKTKETAKETESSHSAETQQQEIKQQKQQEEEKVNQETENELNQVRQSIDEKIAQIETDLAKAAQEKALDHEISTTAESLAAQMKVIKDEIAKNKEDAYYKTKIERLDNQIASLPIGWKNRHMKEGEGIIDWSKRQAGLVFDKKEWTSNRQTNTIRAASGVALVGGAIRGVKKIRKGLFGDNESEKKEKSEGEEKKGGFWNSWIGKGLKRGAIGVGGFLGIRALINRASGPADPETSSNPSERTNNTYTDMKEKDPNRAENADKVGNTINDFWLNTIFHNTAGRKENDMLGETTGQGFVFDKTPGTILANMDTQYSTVSTMLSSFDYIADDVQNIVNKPYYAIKEWGEEKITQLLKPVAGIVEGIKESFRGSDGKLTEEGKTELAKDNPTRDAQLHDIFAKYMKIKLWYQTMLQSVRRKFAADALGGNPTDEQIEEYLADESKSAQIDARVKTDFLNLKPIDAAMSLEKLNVTNKLPVSMQEHIDEINTKHETYKNPDIEKVITNNESPATHAESLKASCWKFLDVLNDPIVKRNRLGNIANTLGLDIFSNSEGQDIDAIADSMGLTALVQGYSTEVSSILKKLEDKTATVDDIKNLDQIMESFRMFQIEVTLGGLVKNTSDTESSLLTSLGEWTISWIKGPDGNLSIEKITIIGIAGYLIVKTSIGKKAIGGLKYIGKGVATITNPTNLRFVRKIINRSNLSNNRIRSKMYKGPEGLKFFSRDLKRGNLSFDDAADIYNRLRKGSFGNVGDSFEKFLQAELNLSQNRNALTDGKLLLENARCRQLLHNGTMSAEDILKHTDRITSLGSLDDVSKKALIEALGHGDISSLSTRASHLAEVANMHIDISAQKKIMETRSQTATAANRSKIDDALKQVDNLINPKSIDLYANLSSQQLQSMKKIFAVANGSIDDLTHVSKILSVDKLDDFLDGLKKLQKGANYETELKNLLKFHGLDDLAVKQIKAIEKIIDMFHGEATALKGLSKAGGWIIDAFKTIAKVT